MKRLTDEQLKMAVDKSAWVDASPHEWPTQEDIWLLCNAVLDSRAEVERLRGELAEALAIIKREDAAARLRREAGE